MCFVECQVRLEHVDQAHGAEAGRGIPRQPAQQLLHRARIDAACIGDAPRLVQRGRLGEVWIEPRARGEQELGRGDVVCFPPGPEGAHKVTCRGDETARVLMTSTKQTPAIAVYPDSDKVGVFPGDDRDRLMMRRATLDYWDGEA